LFFGGYIFPRVEVVEARLFQVLLNSEADRTFCCL